jgi:hypothetical protein
MALSIVDGFEAVNVDERDAHRLSGAACASQTPIEFGLPGASVSQTGQRIGMSKMVKLGQELIVFALLSPYKTYERLNSRAHDPGKGDE